MNDLPSVMLIQQANSKPISGEELESLGKYAASKYLNGEASLTDAVIETVKRAGLSPEQVKRVTEFANTTAYLSEFRKEGSNHKVIEFNGGPADISVILRDLNDGGGGTVFDKAASDYSCPPPDVKALTVSNTSALGVMEEKLAQAFGVAAEPVLPYAEPLQDAWDMKQKLAAAYDLLGSEITELEGIYRDLGDKLFEEVKQASLSGTTLGQIVATWDAAGTSGEYVKVAFQSLTPKLLDSGTFTSREAMGDSLQKHASVGLVNKEHPLVSTFTDFCDALTKIAQAREAREEVVGWVDSVNTFLRDAATKEAEVKTALLDDATQGKAEAMGQYMSKGVDYGKKGWKALKGYTGEAGTAVQKALTPIHPGLGTAAGALVKASPYIGGALVAEEGYQRVKNNPYLQGVKNFALSRVPHTQPWMIRQMQLQGMTF